MTSKVLVKRLKGRVYVESWAGVEFVFDFFDTLLDPDDQGPHLAVVCHCFMTESVAHR